MRQALINENADLVAENHRYVMRITGDDTEGQAELGNFIDPEVELPGHRHHLAPALDRRRRADLPADRARPRGRLDDRVQADRRPRHPRPRGHKKFYFTLIDFRGRPTTSPTRIRRRAGADLRARRGRSHDAADDAPPIRRGRRALRPSRAMTRSIVDDPTARRRAAARSRRRSTSTACRRTHRRRAGGVPRRGRQAGHREPARLHQEGADAAQFASLDDFLRRWNAAERKQAIIDELEARACCSSPSGRRGRQGPRPLRPHLPRRLRPPPLTRRERAEKSASATSSPNTATQARAVLDALLDKYAGRGRDRPRRPERPADRAVRPHWVRRCSCIRAVRLASADFEASRP